MAKDPEVNVTVHIDALAQRVQELCGKLDELSELVPEWSAMEADQLKEDIGDILGDVITAKRRN